MNPTFPVLRVTHPPSFKNGLEILCNLKSMLSEIDCLTKDNPKIWQSLIFTPHFEIRRMADLQNEAFQNLDSTNPEAAKIQKIWNEFYDLINFRIQPTVRTVREVKSDLYNWIKNHEIGNKIPDLHTNELYEQTPLVIVNSSDLPTKNSISNVIAIDQIKNELELVYESFLNYLDIQGTDEFKETIQHLICTIMSYDEGRWLITNIIDEIVKSSLQIKLTIQEGSCSEFFRLKKTMPTRNEPLWNYILHLGKNLETIVVTIPEKGEKRSFYNSPDTFFYHELLHFLHFLKYNGPSQITSLNLDYELYTNVEEARTIAGSPNTISSENAYRSCKNSAPRYGHIGGCDPNLDNPIANLKHAVEYNLSGDFEWIIPLLLNKMNIDIESEIQAQSQALKNRVTLLYPYSGSYRWQTLKTEFIKYLKVDDEKISKATQNALSQRDLQTQIDQIFKNAIEDLTSIILKTGFSKSICEHFLGIYNLTHYFEMGARANKITHSSNVTNNFNHQESGPKTPKIGCSSQVPISKNPERELSRKCEELNANQFIFDFPCNWCKLSSMTFQNLHRHSYPLQSPLKLIPSPTPPSSIKFSVLANRKRQRPPPLLMTSREYS